MDSLNIDVFADLKRIAVLDERVDSLTLVGTAIDGDTGVGFDLGCQVSIVG